MCVVWSVQTLICYPGMFLSVISFCKINERKQEKLPPIGRFDSCSVFSHRHRCRHMTFIFFFFFDCCYFFILLYSMIVVMWFFVFRRMPKFRNRANLIEIESQQKKASNYTLLFDLHVTWKIVMCSHACTHFTIVCGIF